MKVFFILLYILTVSARYIFAFNSYSSLNSSFLKQFLRGSGDLIILKANTIAFYLRES